MLIPDAIGFIPDGNRRYAKKNNLTLNQAYELGFQKAEEVFDWCLEKGIRKAVIYALSTENVNRNQKELEILFELYKKYLKMLSENEKIHKYKVRVELIGEEQILNNFKEEISSLREATSDYSEHQVYVCLGYGGRAELLNAMRRVREQAISISDLDEVSFSKYLWIPFDLDLIIRTGGVSRLSNFALWQSSYAELFFSEKLWPEFSKEDFEKALNFYINTKRNFGR
ncbi:MAG: polyprenyl diphosphate synthase [archaeon]